jgi:hypothetical protein
MQKQSPMTAQEFERRFDEGEDITPFIDMSSIRRQFVRYAARCAN